MSVDSFMRLVDGELGKRMNSAGLYMVSAIRKSLNQSQEYKRYGQKSVYFKGLNPSRPGEYPHKLSGQLIKSIAYGTTLTPEITLIVGSNLKGYPSYLQTGTKNMAARPWLTLAYNENIDKLVQILTGSS